MSDEENKDGSCIFPPYVAVGMQRKVPLALIKS